MELGRHWRLKGQRYRLEGARCTECATVVFPAAERCAACGAPALATERLSGAGTLVSWTIEHQAAEGFGAQTPLVVGMVQLAEGPLIVAQLTDADPEALALDQPVELAIRRLRALGDDGLIVYGYKFRPLLQPNA